MFLYISDMLRNLKTAYRKTLLGLSYTLPGLFDSFLLFFALETTKYMQFVIYTSLFLSVLHYSAIDRNIDWPWFETTWQHQMDKSHTYIYIYTFVLV